MYRYAVLGGNRRELVPPAAAAARAMPPGEQITVAALLGSGSSETWYWFLPSLMGVPAAQDVAIAIADQVDAAIDREELLVAHANETLSVGSPSDFDDPPVPDDSDDDEPGADDAAPAEDDADLELVDGHTAACCRWSERLPPTGMDVPLGSSCSHLGDRGTDPPPSLISVAWWRPRRTGAVGLMGQP